MTARRLAMLLALALAPGLARAGDCGLPPLRPVDAPGLAQRTAQAQAVLTRGGYSVLAIGDSIVRRWPARLLAQALGAEAANAAVGGDGIADVLARLSAAGPIPGAGAVRVVFLMAGSNDLARGASACEVEAATREAVVRLRRIFPGAQVVVAGILPRQGPPRLMTEIDEANARLAAAAGPAGYRFAPLGRQIRAECPDLGECPLFDRRDGKHPTRDGYVDISAELRGR